MTEHRLTATLISCPLVGQKRDPFSSIPSIPIAVPYLAAFLKTRGVRVQCIDGFGENPGKVHPFLNGFRLRGLTARQIVDRIVPSVDIIGISVHSGDCHTVSLEIIKRCKQRFPEAVVVVGGHQATHLYRVFLDAGSDFVVLGEGEPVLDGLIRYLNGDGALDEIDGIAYANRVQPVKGTGQDINRLPFSSFEDIPLDHYWQIGFAHGPTRKGLRYLPLITSRGCPFQCHFCASASFWMRHWKARTPEKVVDEIRYYQSTFNVHHFHIQDPNFATDKTRVQKICRLIVQHNLNIQWCLPSGIKLDTLDRKTLSSMKQAGCGYFNFSPEHASPKILQQMNKPIDLPRMLALTAHADRIGLKKGACFILGYADEDQRDRMLLKKYVRQLIRAGLDEISYYISCPVPGSRDFAQRIAGEFQYYEQLCWSPRWRRNYRRLNACRRKLYLDFLVYKTLLHPHKMVKSVRNVVSGRYELKSEMTLCRFLHNYRSG
jgi:radical SAM superfamily enzyme YgiQ (UPF0313 family)